MKGLRLYKIEKLCSPIAVDLLFAPSESLASAIAYPWRAVWRVNSDRRPQCPRFLISVPKKRLRHAVDRVTMRRRCREAYRLSRDLLPRDCRLDIAFIYVAQSLTPYARTAASMRKLLGRMAASLPPVSTDEDAG